MLVFGLDSREFAYRRLVVVDGARAKVMAGDRSGKRLGEVVGLGGPRVHRGGDLPLG